LTVVAIVVSPCFQKVKGRSAARFPPQQASRGAGAADVAAF
jgi:hypothetical protein